MATKPDSKRFDAETEAMLFEGASISQLGRIFKMDNRSVKAKLHGCPTVKMRAGSPIYDIKEAARYLVTPRWSIDEYIAKMTHADLPMMLRKEYWAAMRSKQIYEQAAGDLWPTEKVQGHISDILKTIAISLRLSADSVERETGITEQQRQVVIRLMDEALGNAHRDLRAILEKKPDAAITDDSDEL